MKRFSQYVRMRESALLDQPGQELKTADIMGRKDGALGKIMKIAWDRYEGETREFLANLAKKDPDIKAEFEAIDSSGKNDGPIRDKKEDGDKDVIAIPPSDVESGDI